MAYASAFLTDEGKIRDRLATKGAIAALPDVVEILEARSPAPARSDRAAEGGAAGGIIRGDPDPGRRR